MSKKFYDLLEVSQDASIEDIKKSYKKLAMLHHPDKNKDNKEESEIKFKEITNAYSVLSDPETRQRYDLSGDENFNNGSGGGQEPNMDDIFQHLFGSRRGGGNNPFGNPFGGHDIFGFNGGHNPNQCNNIVKSYNITLEDIYNGINKQLKFGVKKYCKKCFITCNTCKGSGMIQQFMQMGPMTQIFQSQCNKCNGAKIINKNNKDCMECKGMGLYEIEHMAQLNMPKGFSCNNTIFEGLGEQPQTTSQKAGNLILEFKLTPHSHFVKQDNDLYYKHTITLSESILGKIITIDYFGEQIKINSNQFGIINPSKQYILKNRGLPIYNTSKKGNMIIEFNITYPKLNQDELTNLTTILNKAFIY
jgi:DnaJ-class molecular chaperone